MSREEQSPLRIVRDPEPLGSIIRPIARDLRVLTDLIEAKAVSLTSVIVDARKPSLSEDLREVAHASNVETILDPNSIELSTLGGFQLSGVRELSWASDEPDTPPSLTTRIDEVSEQIAAAAVDLRVDAVLAPTHFLDAAPTWLDLDARLTRTLRSRLSSTRAGRDVRIYYPLVSRIGDLRRPPVLSAVYSQLVRLAGDGTVDAIFLRMHSFGTSKSGRMSFRRYVSLARDLHAIGLPLVAERTGTVGLALLALGCVGGIESGVAMGETYDVRRLQRAKKPRGENDQPIKIPMRIYLPTIGAFLTRNEAKEFFDKRGVRNWFACQGPCCRAGHEDMIRDPRRHFLCVRGGEVEKLSKVPREIRAKQYMDNWLRPASDRAIRATRVLPSLRTHRERLDAWRETVSEIQSNDSADRPTVSPSFVFASQHRAWPRATS